MTHKRGPRPSISFSTIISGVWLGSRSLRPPQATFVLANNTGQQSNSSPSSYADGFSSAPSGSSQYPTYFTSLNGITPYPVRPAWKVAGVDYRVGINTGVTLKDPNTIDPADATLNTGSSPKSVNIQRDDVVLDGYDFTLGGWWRINTGGKRLTIRNCKLESFCVWAPTGNPLSTLLVEYCEVDGLGSSGDTDFGTLFWLNNTSLTMRYTWLHDSQADMVQINTVDTDVRYCLFDTMGYFSGGHSDGIQFAGDGTANNVHIMFNTYVHSKATPASPSSFVDLEIQLSNTAVMNNPEVAYNTGTYTYPSNPVGATFYRTTTANSAQLNNAYVHDNWADPTNMLGVIYDSTPGTGYSKSNNELLTTGQSF